MQDYLIVGFSTHKEFNILSWIIQKTLGTKFSHVYLKTYSDSLDRTLIYQASGLQVNFVGQSVFDVKNKVVTEFKINITAFQKAKIMQTSIDLAGRPYGVKDLFGIAWVLLCAKFGKKVKNPYADGSATEICSELGATILTPLGFVFDDPDTTTPKDVYDKLMEKPWLATPETE